MLSNFPTSILLMSREERLAKTKDIHKTYRRLFYASVSLCVLRAMPFLNSSMPFVPHFIQVNHFFYEVFSMFSMT